MKRDGLARRLGRLAEVRPAPAPPPPADLSRLTDDELDFLIALGEQRYSPAGGWDVAAMTPEERLRVDAVLARVGVP